MIPPNFLAGVSGTRLPLVSGVREGTGKRDDSTSRTSPASTRVKPSSYLAVSWQSRLPLSPHLYSPPHATKAELRGEECHKRRYSHGDDYWTDSEKYHPWTTAPARPSPTNTTQMVTPCRSPTRCPGGFSDQVCPVRIQVRPHRRAERDHALKDLRASRTIYWSARHFMIDYEGPWKGYPNVHTGPTAWRVPPRLLHRVSDANYICRTFAPPTDKASKCKLGIPANV